VSRITFEKIPDLVGEATDLPFEITLTHPCLDTIRKVLTVLNKAVDYQIIRARKGLRAKTKELEGMEECARKTGKINKSRWTMIKSQIDKLNQQIEELLPDRFKLYYGDNDNGTLNAPAGFWWMCDRIVNDFHINTKVPFIPWPESTGKTLRPYQEEAVHAALQYKRSSIVLPTGTGKSLVIYALTNCYLAKGKRVCILEPTIELVKQMKDEADKYFTNVSALGGKFKYQPENSVLISTVQSAGAYIDRYDAVMIDEFHHSACTTIEDTLFSAVNAEYVHGFSACPVRADGLTLGIHAACGPVVYEKDTKWALNHNYLVPPKIAMIKIGLGKRLPDIFNSSRAYSNLVRDPFTCEVLLNLLLKNVTKGRKVLLMFKTVEEGFAFKEYAKDKIVVDVASSEYRGGLYKFKKSECDVLIANSGLVGEGIDIPNMVGLINVTQTSSENMARQIIGRCLRLATDKTDAFFYDVTTMGYGQFERGYESRKKVYETITSDITELTISKDAK
jgi:superfamily II DNA or RNA helicase